MGLSYLVVGAGGVGLSLAGFLAKGGADVSLLARGKQYDTLKQNGLLVRLPDDTFRADPVIVNEDTLERTYDIILVCVKDYALESVYDVIHKATTPKSRIIPILNVYGTGERMQERLIDRCVLCGCIYIAATKGPGDVTLSGNILKVVFGKPGEAADDALLREAAREMETCGVTPVYSDDIRYDAMHKFIVISPWAACGAYYDVSAGAFLEDGEVRSFYIQLLREIISVANALGLEFGHDMAQECLKLVETVSPDYTASMQKDLAKRGPSEIDGLVMEPVRLAKRLGLSVPGYEKVAAKFGLREEDNEKD